jgi:ribosomal protein S18 acetylase RimI-like enzyme
LLLEHRRYGAEVAIRIRAARPGDLATLRDIYRRSSLSNDGDRQVLLDNPEYLVLPDDAVLAGRTRVADWADGDAIVGFATVECAYTTAELVDLFVDPDFTRRGIARALVDDAVAGLSHSGISEMQVTANQHALAFYLATGFEVLDTIATPLGSGLRMRLNCGSRADDVTC